MATTVYTKALYAGTGAMVVYNGANLDDIITLVGAANVQLFAGRLLVFNEHIYLGDGVCVDDTSPTALPHVKIPAATIRADQWIIEAVVYDGSNVDEIASFSEGHVEFRAEKLYVWGQLVEENDAVGADPIAGGGGKLPILAATLSAVYTADT